MGLQLLAMITNLDFPCKRNAACFERDENEPTDRAQSRGVLGTGNHHVAPQEQTSRKGGAKHYKCELWTSWRPRTIHGRFRNFPMPFILHSTRYPQAVRSLVQKLACRAFEHLIRQTDGKAIR